MMTYLVKEDYQKVNLVKEDYQKVNLLKNFLVTTHIIYENTTED